MLCILYLNKTAKKDELRYEWMDWYMMKQTVQC